MLRQSIIIFSCEDCDALDHKSCTLATLVELSLAFICQVVTDSFCSHFLSLPPLYLLHVPELAEGLKCFESVFGRREE